MTANNPLPTPSASASATPSSGSAATAAASASQTTDPAAAAAAAGQPAPGAQQQQQPSPAEAIEILVQQILASNNDAALAGTLLNSLGTPEARESILASVTPAGADPLDALDAARHTIGILFILCVLLFLSFTFFRLLFPLQPGIFLALVLECRARRPTICFFHGCVYIAPFGWPLLIDRLFLLLSFVVWVVPALPRIGPHVSRPHQRLRLQSRSHTSRTSARI